MRGWPPNGSSRRAVLLYVCVFFFFQAEDGIRDLTVTGVQTCALPIFCEDIWSPVVTAHLARAGAELLLVPNGSPFEAGKFSARLELAKSRARETNVRSEERRVGKECRWRWGRVDYKEKRQQRERESGM